MKKAWWRSKTLWINLIAGVALAAQAKWGWAIDADTQGGILATVNIVLRMITKEPVGLTDEVG